MARFALLLCFASGELWQTGAVSLGQKRAPPLEKEVSRCVVWHSQHKSAGMNVELVLSHRPLRGTGVDLAEWKHCHNCTYICDRETWDCGRQTCDVDTSRAEYDPNQYPNLRVAYRGYTPRLAGREPWGSPGDGRCVWATMSREPIHRLVSAYMYCKEGEEGGHFDALCGGRGGEGTGHGFNAANASIQDFAKHWGNFLMRELMWNPDLYELAKSRPDFNPEEPDCFADPWVQFKIQLNGGDDIRTESGKANLKAVEDRLLATNRGHNSLYDVYGVVERWNETMKLFDDKMPLEWPNTWRYVTATHMGIDHGSASYKEEEDKVLEEALNDADVKEALAGDLYLYNKVIAPMFDRQLQELSW